MPVNLWKTRTTTCRLYRERSYVTVFSGMWNCKNYQEIRKHAATTKDAIETISQNIKQLIAHIDSLSKRMNSMKGEVKEGKSLVQKIVGLSTQESKVLTGVNSDIGSIQETFQEYRTWKTASKQT